MKKSITKNYIYNLAYQVLILILPLITTPYVSRILGVENIGIYSYTLSTTAFFILFGLLGTSLYGQREIAFVQDDKQKYSKLFWEIELLRIITISISLIIYYCIFAFKGEYSVYYKILILEVIANSLDISWLFQGIEDFKKTVFRNAIIKILSVVSVFIFIRTKDDLIKYFFIYVISLIVGNMSLWLYLPKTIYKIKFRDLNILRHIKPTIYLFLPQIAVQVYTILDKFMIGSIVIDKAEVGYYEQSQKIIKLLLTIEGAFGTVMMPKIANLFAENKNKEIEESLKTSFRVAYLLAFPMIFGIMIVSDRFVPIYFGEGYQKTATLMKIMSPIILFIGISGCIGYQYLLPTKKQNKYNFSVIFGAVINLIINASLIPKIGAIGAAIGTIIAELSVTGAQMVLSKKDIDILKYLKLYKNYFLSSIVMYIICIVLEKIFNKQLNGIIILISQIIVGALTYIVILYWLKDEVLTNIINKITEKINKNKHIEKEI